jgi:gliding motility-associated lipoprotein GldH
MKTCKYQLVLIGTILIAALACDQNRVFEEYRKIPDKGWNKDSVLVFNVPVEDTLTTHNVYVNIRNDIKYNYSNLWLFIGVEQPGGPTAKDTFELLLADPAGKWLGKGIGGIKTNQVIFKRNVYFPVSGNYRISLQQGMRENILTQITEVGLRVEKVN